MTTPPPDPAADLADAGQLVGQAAEQAEQLLSLLRGGLAEDDQHQQDPR